MTDISGSSLCKHTVAAHHTRARRYVGSPTNLLIMGGACTTCIQNHFEDVHLKKCTADNTKLFIPDVQRGKVVLVYDGDTLTLAARHARHGKPHLFKVRLRGIDAPEIRSKSAEEKAAAVAAKAFLESRVLDHVVILENVGTEKYGRLLATVKYRGRDLSHELLKAGHAQPYEGGKKPEWSDTSTSPRRM